MRKQKDRGADRRTAAASIIVGLLMVGLATTTVLVLVLANTASAKPKNPIVHTVIAGGPDACAFLFEAHPGCDGNYSLQAFQYADGTASGQYVDRFANGNGMNAVIDCLTVEGNRAWISGTIIRGQYSFVDDDGVEVVVDISGLDFVTSVQDNGTSANDAVDQISYSWICEADFPENCLGPCTDKNEGVFLFDSPDGDVIVD